MREQRPDDFEGFLSWLGLRLEARVDPSSSGLFVYITDVTQRRGKDDELARSRQRESAALLETTSQPFVAGSRSGGLYTANRAFADLTGFRLDELYSLDDWVETLIPHVAEGVHPLDSERLRRTGEPQLLERELVRKDGERVPIEALLHLGRDESEELIYYAFVNDVSERQRAEAERQGLLAEVSRDRARLQAVFASMTKGVVISDAGANVVDMNPAALRMHGFETVEQVPRRPEDWREVEFWTREGELLSRSEWPHLRVARGEILGELLLEQRDRATGERRLWRFGGAPVYDEAGCVALTVLTIADVTKAYVVELQREQLIRELEALERLADTASSTLDLEALLPRMLESVIAALGADMGALLLWQEDRLIAQASVGLLPQEGSEPFSLALGQGVAGTVALTGEPVCVEDLITLEPDPILEHIMGQGVRAMMAVPLHQRGEVLGVLHVDWPYPRRAEPSAIRFLREAGARCSLAITNARLYGETAEARRLSAALNDLNQLLNSASEQEDIFGVAMRQAALALGVDSALVQLREGGHWVVRHTYGSLVELIGRAYEEEELPIVALVAGTEDVLALDDSFGDHETLREIRELWGARAVLAAPLIVRGSTEGLLFFNQHSARPRFNSVQAGFVRQLAGSVSLALDNARLHKAERRIAQTIQEALLTVPVEVEGVRFGHLYRSATELAKVGGDFYDLFPLDDGRVAFLIGDVSGHGVEASRLASLSRDTVRTYAYQMRSPRSILAYTNRALLRNPAFAGFITLLFGVLDTPTGEVVYCSAGHPPGVVRRADGALYSLAVGSPPLGIFDDTTFEVHRFHMALGDMLVLFTDGLFEARVAGGEPFGEERLLNVIAAAKALGPGELPLALLEAATQYSGGRLTDDIAVLVVDIEPRPSAEGSWLPDRA